LARGAEIAVIVRARLRVAGEDAAPPDVRAGSGKGPPGSQTDLAPAGTRAKVAANLDALRALRSIQDDGRPATADEQARLAPAGRLGRRTRCLRRGTRRPRGPARRAARAAHRQRYRAAARTTLNAHYTDAALVSAMWGARAARGFEQTAGRVEGVESDGGWSRSRSDISGLRCACHGRVTGSAQREEDRSAASFKRSSVTCIVSLLRA
jgi:hypothetical protein